MGPRYYKLLKLSLTLKESYKVSMTLEDLERALKATRDALALAPFDMSLAMNLSYLLLDRCQRLGSPSDND